MTAGRLAKMAVAAAALVLVNGYSWAAPEADKVAREIKENKVTREIRENKVTEEKFKRISAPEIDASAGASAIALLAGVILLLRERSRSRES